MLSLVEPRSLKELHAARALMRSFVA